MTILNSIRKVKSVKNALDAVRGEAEKRISIVVIAKPQVEAELISKLQLRSEKEAIFGLSDLPSEQEKRARLKTADLALAVISPGESNESLRDMVRQASVARSRLIMVTGQGIDEWLVENLAEVFKVSGEDVAFVSLIDKGSIQRVLIPRIVDKLAKKEIALGATLSVFRREVAKRIISDTAKQNAAIGALVFIPGADMPLMTLNQIKMMFRLAAVYNEELSVRRLNEVLATIGGGFAFREVARQLLGLVPVAGWAVKGGIGYTGTVAMGRLAVKYFEREMAK